MAGRSVRLFLIDGTPQGMRTAEVGNWTGLALVCPRTELVRLGSRGEVHRTGVYNLVGPSESSASKLAVYVGEGDEVWARLTSHAAVSPRRLGSSNLQKLARARSAPDRPETVM